MLISMTKSRSKRPKATKDAVYNNWLMSYRDVKDWMGQYDLDRLVAEGGGLCRISNFLPAFVADGALRQLERVPDSAWQATAAQQDYSSNDISHAFRSIMHDADLEPLLRVFSLLDEDALCTFSAARYDRTHHIVAHDDRQHVDMMLDSGEVCSCSRR